MDWKGFVKRLDLPDGFPAPTELAFGDVRARAISRADLDEDVRGINASIDLIRRTRGASGRWLSSRSCTASLAGLPRADSR